MPAAVFLDLEGIVAEARGSASSRMRLHPGVISALQKLQQKFELFIIAPCSSKESTGQEQARRVNRALAGMLKEQGVHIRDHYLCPRDLATAAGSAETVPECMLEASRAYSLSLKRSFMIGNHPSAACMGEAEGVFGAYLLTGQGKNHILELPEDKLVFHNIADAGEWIVSHPEGEAAIRSMIKKGAEALREGGLTVFPTETVYGLGADALNENAVRKIYEVKQRPLSNPLIVHVADATQAEPLVEQIDERARSLMDALWPGPLTLIFPKSDAVPDIVSSGLPNVAIRMPAGPIARALIKETGAPLAAPSANAFGRISPTTAEHVRKQLEGGYDVLIDGGACRVGVESTVLSLVGDKPRILRPVAVTKEQIESVTGPVEKPEQQPRNIESPGMLPSHYAPRTAMRLLKGIPEEMAESPDVGFLLFAPPEKPVAGPCEILSPQGNIAEAAIHLYAALRRLDALDLRLLIALPLPERGIGIAINDRLKKAAHGAG